jgi:pimeloyl-ACP methyl ester carboxylesterase
VLKNRLKSFVYKTEHIDTTLAELYSQPFRVDQNSKRLSLWLRDYMLDPLKYPSTQSSEYEKLTIPVRVIWGKEDTLAPISLAEDLMKKLKHGKLYTLNAVGHIPMIEDYEALDNSLLRAFNE